MEVSPSSFERLRPAKADDQLFIDQDGQTLSSVSLALKKRRKKIIPTHHPHYLSWYKRFWAGDLHWSWPIQDRLWNVVLVIWTLSLIRLMTMDQGLLDYYRRQHIIEQRREELDFLVSENELLRTDLRRMQEDRRYQKMLVNEYLGFIEKDEYLLVFPEDRDSIPKQVNPPPPVAR